MVEAVRASPGHERNREKEAGNAPSVFHRINRVSRSCLKPAGAVAQ